MPLQWAATQTNLGNALWHLGVRESGMARLEEGGRRLSRRPQGNNPPARAASMGHDPVGARESGTARLEEAVAAFRDALKERTREHVPPDWAMSFGKEGVTLMLLAERTKDGVMAETALLQIEAAFETFRSAGDAPNAAYYKARIPKARRIRDALKGGPE